MVEKTEKDLWIEMSIREIWTQCHFAEIAYGNIDIKSAANNDIIFSSIHSFLSHAAIVSKLLKANDEQWLGILPQSHRLVFGEISIGRILGVPVDSFIHKRTFRNNLEHYDRELKKWIKKYGVNAKIATYNIGPKHMLPGFLFVSHYEPTTEKFTFVNEDFELDKMLLEIKKVKTVADTWVKKMEQGIIRPPFNPD